MNTVIDERFADIVFDSTCYCTEVNRVRIGLKHDPADGADAIVLEDVVAFDTIHFGRQNVISHLEYGVISGSDVAEFANQARLRVHFCTFGNLEQKGF